MYKSVSPTRLVSRDFTSQVLYKVKWISYDWINESIFFSKITWSAMHTIDLIRVSWKARGPFGKLVFVQLWHNERQAKYDKENTNAKPPKHCSKVGHQPLSLQTLWNPANRYEENLQAWNTIVPVTQLVVGWVLTCSATTFTNAHYLAWDWHCQISHK